MLSRSNDREDTMSAIEGPLFLTERQLITPKETGPGIMEISLHNKNKTEKPVNLEVVGKFFTLWQQLACLKERGSSRLEPWVVFVL